MELTLWDSSFHQATPEESNDVIHGLKHDFYFRCALDVIEESALNEKCCVQVLRKLIKKADNEIVELEEELVILQSQLAWADEEWSQLCTIALREKIDCLDISIRSLKNETLQHEYDFGYCLQMHREPAERLHDILKALLSNFSHQKNKQELSADRPAQATKLLVEKKQTRSPASNTIRNLQVKEFTITSAEKLLISEKLSKSLVTKTISSGSAKLANTLSNADKQRSIKVEAIEHTLTPADLLMTQKSSLQTLMKRRNHLEPLKYQPLAIVFPHSSSNGEKLAIGHSKEIIPRNSNSVITIRKPTNKSSTTSAPFLTLSSKHERRTCVEDKQKSSTGCNGRKRLSNIDSRIINEKVGAQSSTGKSIILVSSLEPRGKGTNNSIIVKPTDTTSDSRSDSSKEAIEDSTPGSKLIKGPDAAPNNIDISNSVSKEDKKITSTRRVKAQETTASGTTSTATTSLLELLYNRQENTKIPRSKRNIRVQLPNEVQKAKEPGRNSDPMSQKRRKVCLNSPVLEGTKALAILHDDEANSMAENVKTLHCPTLLDDLTVIELKAIAKLQGMTGYSKLRKVDLARKLGMKLNHRGLRKGNRNGTNVLRIMPGEP